MNISLCFRTVVTYTLIGIFLTAAIPILAAIALLPPRWRYTNRLYFYIVYLFYRWAILVSFLPLDVQGIEHIPDQPVIFVANHQSSIDIPLIGYINGLSPHTWLVLEYYAQKPILGFFIRRMCVPVDRSDRRKAARSLIAILKMATTYPTNIIIFPEGARHADKKVHEFFSGFAILAQKTRRPVIPVYMPNNGEIYPVNSFLIYYHPIVMRIGKPFVYQADDTPERFASRVHAWFVEQTI